VEEFRGESAAFAGGDQAAVLLDLEESELAAGRVGSESWAATDQAVGAERGEAFTLVLPGTGEELCGESLGIGEDGDTVGCCGRRTAR
jgi:hypothetical protein